MLNFGLWPFPKYQYIRTDEESCWIKPKAHPVLSPASWSGKPPNRRERQTSPPPLLSLSQDSEQAVKRSYLGFVETMDSTGEGAADEPLCSVRVVEKADFQGDGVLPHID